MTGDREDARASVDTFANISPGYHMHNRHWISVTLPTSKAPLPQIISESYDLVVAGLPRAKRPKP